VWLADCGYEAINLYANHKNTINVVLLDVRMAVMDGPQTLTALLKLDPLVRCCFMSGELGSFSEGKPSEMGVALVLRKPFRLADVARLLWELAAPLGSATAMQSSTDGAMSAGFVREHRGRRVGLRRARST
jgi:CheY-like chemotaxis protein